MTFNPNEHLINLKGKDYLPVQWRLVWFREKCPQGLIETDVIKLDLDAKIAVFKASVCDGNGGQSTGHGSESAKDFQDYIEKAETKAIGRALAALGFGTQFAGEELDEMPRIVDSPVDHVSLQLVKELVLKSGLASDLKSWQEYVTRTIGVFVTDDKLSKEQIRQLMPSTNQRK